MQRNFWWKRIRTFDLPRVRWVKLSNKLDRRRSDPSISKVRFDFCVATHCWTAYMACLCGWNRSSISSSYWLWCCYSVFFPILQASALRWMVYLLISEVYTAMATDIRPAHGPSSLLVMKLLPRERIEREFMTLPQFPCALER